eukprot:CAMPEP_0183762784 /NCGR_PEP_ID=MMETSP0739-20130205/9299_1 /TAXON_ID=385413 /ORGANISM="Thalassiosira miniscula, Strain CCMP1093" /LENGTH=241 /DNA_ID=CAMNT_0026001119 /DNA_START=111 /DNA_END=836 /DNA_ORIENTATION=-
MAIAKRNPLPRPYTTYNIFFQLEREYILQHDLDVIPKLSPEEIFNCSDERYEGPPLPMRYQGLTLSHDWYIPGKALRKKRQHRASHGKISFIDLSKKVSSSWRNCEDSIKLFCAHVSDICAMKYKLEMHKHKKHNHNNNATAVKKKSCGRKKKMQLKPNKVLQSGQQHGATSCASSFICPEIKSRLSRCLSPDDVSSILVHMSDGPKSFGLEPAGVRSMPMPKIDIVDILDREIYQMWMRA